MTIPVSTRSREAVAEAFREQLAPLVRLRAELTSMLPIAVDRETAAARLEAGRCAFDALAVVDDAGDLTRSFHRALAAYDAAGLAPGSAVEELRRRTVSAHALVAAWASGEPAPRDPVRHVAHRAAGLVGNALLRRAAEAVRHGHERQLADWLNPTCPCCGSAPDLALVRRHERTLVCARCDTTWRAPGSGCLGCGATDEPTIAHIRSAYLGYRVVICNSCGRYLKERPGAGDCDPLIERALTAELDEAAERRGLRL